ncbi:YhhN-like protein [Terricaulis silvestris]|uniref:YhhN-like protein n=2 Tax=Terricaulis silvestris TaxID=2686094 RepID=A0A6I6MVB1_9CAUL|nr:YhhN-like protein [Terricaulis silvestris]
MGMEFGPVFWALAALSAVAAVTYGLYFLNRPSSFLRAIVKTIFMGALTAAFVIAGAPFPLLVALAAAAAGDFWLAFDKPAILPLGILSFLLAQLAYLAIFFGLWMFSGDNAPRWPRYVAMIAIAAALVVYLLWFWRDELKSRPISGGLAVLTLFLTGALLPWFILIAISASTSDEPLAWTAPQIVGPLVLLVVALVLGWLRREMRAIKLGGMVYGGAITAMALQAMWLPWMGWPAMLGAVLFLTSDFVLSAELFRLAPDSPARRLTAPIVWWTYAGAQALIVTGVVLVVLQS